MTLIASCKPNGNDTSSTGGQLSRSSVSTYKNSIGCDTSSWWNSQYTLRMSINVKAPAESSITRGYPVSFRIDHKLMVDSGISHTTGKDFRIVYMDPYCRFHEVPRIVHPSSQWSRGDTSIWFPVPQKIEAGQDIQGVFAYFRNPNADFVQVPMDSIFDDFENFNSPPAEGRFKIFNHGQAVSYQQGALSLTTPAVPLDKLGPFGLKRNKRFGSGIAVETSLSIVDFAEVGWTISMGQRQEDFRFKDNRLYLVVKEGEKESLEELSGQIFSAETSYFVRIEFWSLNDSSILRVNGRNIAKKNRPPIEFEPVFSLSPSSIAPKTSFHFHYYLARKIQEHDDEIEVSLGAAHGFN